MTLQEIDNVKECLAQAAYRVEIKYDTTPNSAERDRLWFLLTYLRRGVETLTHVVVGMDEGEDL